MTPTPFGPAYTLQTARTLLRCWSPADAARALRAIDASLDHLRPWLDWARHYPISVEQQAAVLRRFRGSFDLGQDFTYAVSTGVGRRSWAAAGCILVWARGAGR